MEKLGTLESEVLSHEVVDGRVKVVVRTVPGMKLPRVVRPVLRGKEVEFVDTRTFLQRDKETPFARDVPHGEQHHRARERRGRSSSTERPCYSVPTPRW